MTDFARQIETEIPRLRRYARALTRDVTRADDLVQSCLTRAVAKQHLWQPGTDLRAWLFTILHNQFVNNVRRSVREGTAINAEASRVHLSSGPAQGDKLALRDLQRAMGDQKKPWEIGKSFDLSAPIGPIHKVGQTGHFLKGAISLAVNGTVKQNADLSYMIWSVAEQISKLSEAFELKAGDLIYSGTPENVGPVVKGDVMLARIDGLPDLSLRVI